MDLIQLEYFITVVETGTFVKAADQLHVTQPALSRSIMRMENSIGVSLFERKNKQVELTAYGEVMYGWAKKTMQSYGEAMYQIEQMQQTAKKTLNIACSGYMYTTPLILGFHTKYPDIDISNFKFGRFDFPDIIFKENVDCVLSVVDYKADNVESVFLYSGDIYVTLPVNHPLAHRKEVYLEEIKDERLVMPAGDSLYGVTIEEMFQKIGAVPKISSRVQTPYLIQMVIEGLGISIVNEETVNDITSRSRKCVCIPLADDFCETNAYLLWRKNSVIPENLKLFRDYLLQEV